MNAADVIEAGQELDEADDVCGATEGDFAGKGDFNRARDVVEVADVGGACGQANYASDSDGGADALQGERGSDGYLDSAGDSIDVANHGSTGSQTYYARYGGGAGDDHVAGDGSRATDSNASIHVDGAAYYGSEGSGLANNETEVCRAWGCVGDNDNFCGAAAASDDEFLAVNFTASVSEGDGIDSFAYTVCWYLNVSHGELDGVLVGAGDLGPGRGVKDELVEVGVGGVFQAFEGEVEFG